MEEKSSKEFIFVLILLVIGVAFYSYNSFVYKDKVKQIVKLNKKIEKLNEQLIAAQILDKNLAGVVGLIQSNLATDETDPLITTSVIPFLKFITTTLDEMEIELISIQPQLTKKVKKGNYVESPYEIEVYCNYAKLGKLLNRIEKSDRLVSVNSMEVKSNIDYLLGKDHTKGIDNHVIAIELSTLTLLKKES